jgi:hypothetical protein
MSPATVGGSVAAQAVAVGELDDRARPQYARAGDATVGRDLDADDGGASSVVILK